MDRTTRPSDKSGHPEAERTHVAASGRNGQNNYVEDEICTNDNHPVRSNCQDVPLTWWQPQSPVTASTIESGSDTTDFSELLSMLDEDDLRNDEVDAVAIDEVVAMMEGQEEGQLWRHPVPASVPAAMAAAAVHQELKAANEPAIHPIPMPLLPCVPLVTPLAGLEVPKKALEGMTPQQCRDLLLMQRQREEWERQQQRLNTKPRVLCLKQLPGPCTPAVNTKSKSSHRNNRAGKRSKRWSVQETACLEQGVALHGEGNWLKIKQHFQHELAARSNVDLKDRWRNVAGNRQSRKRKSVQVPVVTGKQARLE